ncbi:MAG: hypothetical protein HYV55_00545 [Parcubacteria group bacterium]|nr:hypothetical protein [Parcubacteria group bacterium]
MSTKLIEQKQQKDVLKKILEELRRLRREIAGLYPQEDLDEYAHPERIKRSYQKALRQYPPRSA